MNKNKFSYFTLNSNLYKQLDIFKYNELNNDKLNNDELNNDELNDNNSIISTLTTSTSTMSTTSTTSTTSTNNLKKNDKLKNKTALSTKYKKKIIPKHIKTLIWNKYIGEDIIKHKCLCCKKEHIKITDFEAGHVLSEFYGGSNEIDNLRPICRPCNASMGTMHMIEYIKMYGLYI